MPKASVFSPSPQVTRPLFPFMVFLLSLFSGCSLLAPNRSFLIEMEDEGIEFFQPGEDFPVVSGDRRDPQSLRQREILRRTPQTPREEKRAKAKKALREELAGLEDNLTEEGFQHYMKHKKNLPALSERIFFLRLASIRERDEYLFGKGHREEFQQTTPAQAQAIREREIAMGMSKDAVVQSWGRPVNVEVAGRAELENERWLFYDQYGRPKQVFFEQGRVSGWIIE